jgi:outer membrane immunogenic protein
VKKLFVTGIAAAAALCGAPALAADMAVKAPLLSTPTYSWAGFYVGANAGGHWGTDNDPAFTSVDTNFTSTNIAIHNQAAPANLKPAGFAGGIHFGYNWQKSNVVVGLEADIDGLAGTKSRAVTVPLTVAPATSTFTDSARDNWMSTLRVRAGFLPTDQILIFATGGLALSSWSLNHSFSSTGAGGPSGTDNRTVVRTGWTVGGGLEYALKNNWFVRAEYLYANFGTTNSVLVTQCPCGPFITNFAEPEKLSENIVRVGISYLFH